PTEKAGRVDQQISSFEGEKILTRAGADIAPSSRSIDNKTDIPAMTKPLSHPEWNKDLGDRIVWMSSKAIPSAEIRLNPQHLGPISVRVDVADDQATVVFTAQHASVRETIEASIPKLREMMGAQQLNLADVSVSQGSASDQGRSQSQNFAQTADGRGQRAMIVDDIDDVEQEVASGRAVVSNGLLSIYA
ncbi:MAG: flagellar hook-length control protein FliK, partial [Methylobacter sp.]